MTSVNLQSLHQSIQSFSSKELNPSVIQSNISNIQSNIQPKHSRKRGVILTQQGLQKLRKSDALCDKYGNRYSYETLAGFAQLDPRTVSRILSCETKIDKRTLKIFFNTFNLQLEAEDYTAPDTDYVPYSISTDELMQLKQRLIQDYTHLLNLLNLDNPSLLA